MAAGTVSYPRNAQPVGIAGGLELIQAKITAPNAGAGQTNFTVAIEGCKVGDIVIISPTNAAAAALNAGASVTAAGTVTVVFASATLGGTETFDVNIWKQS